MPKSKAPKKASRPREPAPSPRAPSSNPPVLPPSGSAAHGAHAVSSAPAQAPSPSGASLLRLERPFDLDEFCQQLGENKVTATVPREQLAEVLKRVVEFMEFGIYVYAVVVLPSPSATLEKFQVSLDRIDFDPARKGWTPFHEKGRSDSPFGPTGKGPTNRAAPH